MFYAGNRLWDTERIPRLRRLPWGGDATTHFREESPAASERIGRAVYDAGVGRRCARVAIPRAKHVRIALQIIEKNRNTGLLRLVSGWIVLNSETDLSLGRRDTLPEMEELQAFGDRALDQFGSDLGTAFRPYPQTVPGHNRCQ